MDTREMTNKMQDWQKLATEKARDFGQVTDQYVRENTWRTLAIAAALGCLVGYLLGSSRAD